MTWAINHCPSDNYFGLQHLNIYNFISFCLILMEFLPKCMEFYLLSEEGHGTRIKGHGDRIKGHGAAPS